MTVSSILRRAQNMRSKMHCFMRCTLFWFMSLLAPLSMAEVGDMPEPAYEFRVDVSVLVLMRDGVRLSTDLYMPIGTGPWPTILIRTQYDKSRYYEKPRSREGDVVAMFAGQGFVVAVQDIRGKFESEGTYTLAESDARDGYDTVDWLAKQSWSNGKVGTYGCSSLGITQIFQAPLRHPALKAMIPQAAGGATRRQLWDMKTSGVPEIGWALDWWHRTGSKIFARPEPGFSRQDLLEFVRYFDTKPKIPDVDYDAIRRTSPVISMAERAGGPPSDFVDWVSHEAGDPWFDKFGFYSDGMKIDVPSLFTNSWYDMSQGETLRLFNSFRVNAVSRQARNNQFVIISPTEHCRSEAATDETRVGDRNLGDARFDYWRTYIDWFDHWLRTPNPGDFDAPKVRYYLMGANVWQEADAWPPTAATPTKYYLQNGVRELGPWAEGALSTASPSMPTVAGFDYDPAVPVSTNGIMMKGAADQRPVLLRQDVLAYTTEPLMEPVTVVGPVEAVLYVSSTAKDTDFTASLIDVYPDGTAFNLVEGIVRMRYREGLDKKVWMEPGNVYPATINLQATANTFLKGHRIMLAVSSSNFPRFARNFNTGGDGITETVRIVAHNTVHTGENHLSHVVLHVIGGYSPDFSKEGMHRSSE